MRKLVWANLGAAAALGTGVMGATIAITHKVKADNAYSNNVSDINNIFKNIQNLYGRTDNIQQVTDSNYNSLYDFIQKSIAGTVASIQTSTNKALELQKGELIGELNKLRAVFDAHESLDANSFSAIYTQIQQMNASLESIADKQEQFEAQLNRLLSDYQDTAKNFWSSVDGLNTLINQVSANTNAKFSDVESAINAIQQKLLSVDELRSMIVAIENVVTEISNRFSSLISDVMASTDKNSYDITLLNTALVTLRTSAADLDVKISSIEGTIDSMWGDLNNMYAELAKLSGKADLTQTDIAAIKNQLADMLTFKDKTILEQQALRTQFGDINDKINELFIGNSYLQSQVNYLNEQNTMLYQNFLYLQAAINNLEDLYGTGSAATVSIKPSQTDSNYVIYEKGASGSGIVRYPSIEIPNLERAKRFAIYVKVTNTTTNTSYVTQIIDSYPDYDYKMIGSSTQGFANEQFLISVGLDRNVDKINVNGIWMRKSSDAWKTSKDIDNTKVQITNVVVNY